MKTCPKPPTLLKWSRMTLRSQLIFDKSDLVCSRTEECKNHSHKLKLKTSEVIFTNGCQNFGYMSLNSSSKINPNGSTIVSWTDTYTKLIQKPSTEKPIIWSKQALDPNSKQSFN